MNIPDTTRLLKALAAADQRTVGEADIIFWSQVLPQHIEIDDALQGVIIYYRHDRSRIMPSDLIIAAREARCRRTGERMWYES